MAKTKTPFLSLTAQGSVGGSITAQKRPAATMLRSKPFPAYRQTFHQLRQRHLYRVACQCWNGLTATQKESYRDAATLTGLTIFPYFIRTILNLLSETAIYLPLNEHLGDLALDYSLNANHSTIYGATPAPAYYDYGLSFDGLNDYVEAPNVDSLEEFTAKTVLIHHKPGAFTGAGRYLYYASYWAYPYGDTIFFHVTINRHYIVLRNPAGAIVQHTYNFAPDTDIWLGYTWDGSNLITYAQGAPVAGPTPFAGPLRCTARRTNLGHRHGDQWYDSLTDEFFIWRKALTATEMRILSNRSNTPQ